MQTLKIKRVRDNTDVPLPRYESDWSSGLDLRADVAEKIVLQPGQRRLVPSGIAVEMEKGFEIQVRPRSGLALRKGVSMVNTPGTIDADYRGEIGVILINHGDEDFLIERGDRIAQMVVCPVIHPEIIEVNDLHGTGRGAGGFGSTGKG